MEFNQLKDYDINVLTYLNNTNTAARDDFLKNPSLVKPQNVYDNLEIETLKSQRERVFEALTEVERQEKTAENRFLREYLTFILLKYDFVSTCYAYNTAAAAKEKENLKEQHQELCFSLYGQPDRETFLALLKRQVDCLNKNQLTSEQVLLLEQLKQLITDQTTTYLTIFEPKSETITEFSKKIKAYYHPLLKCIPDNQNNFTVAEACAIANKILDQVVNQGKDSWTAIVDPIASNASVIAEEKLVKFPGNSKKGHYSLKRLRGLLVHEIGVHVFRHTLFQKEKNTDLVLGLPGYLTCEEGIAKVMEQAINEEFIESGIMHYISIGLAVFHQLNFREIFDIQKLLFHIGEGKSTSICFNSVQRALRGTGELPNTKDLVYYNGSNQVWAYVEENLNNPDLLSNLLHSGKIDIFNPKHPELRDLLWRNT